MKHSRFLLWLFSFFIGMTVSFTAFSQRPIDLYEPLPGTSQITMGSGPLDALNQYLQPFLPLVVGMSAGLAILMIIIGGFQIMLGGGSIAQSEGLNRILTAIGGLMILIFSAALLYMLNANYFIISP